MADIIQNTNIKVQPGSNKCLCNKPQRLSCVFVYFVKESLDVSSIIQYPFMT